MGQELKGKKILLVDDDSVLQHLYGETLISLGVKLLRAVDGVAALNIANQELPDLIITNIMMPYMNGLELIESLKNAKETRHIPIIVLSALIPHNDEAIKRGADLCLVKSEILPKDLKNNVIKLLTANIATK